MHPTDTNSDSLPVIAGPVQPAFRERSVTDSDYLLSVIRYLTKARGDRGLTLEEVARRARLKRSVIDRAERDCWIPKCREFKSWAEALGLTWEQVWSDCLSAG